MNGSTSGEVERGECVEPSICIPCPASDGAIDDCSPEEAEDQGRNETSSLEATTDHNLYRTSTINVNKVTSLELDHLPEQHLIQAEDDLGNDSTSWTGRSHDILHPKVGEVTDKRTRGSRVCQSIPPKHPLEGRNSSHHQTLEQESHGGLAAGQTPIEQTDTRNNEPDDEATEHKVSIVIFETSILGIDIHHQRVSALRFRAVK